MGNVDGESWIPSVLMVDAMIPAVAGYVEAAQAASRAPVRKVVVMGKWTNAGCFGWLREVSYRVMRVRCASLL
jgi:hypothetical protein